MATECSLWRDAAKILGEQNAKLRADAKDAALERAKWKRLAELAREENETLQRDLALASDRIEDLEAQQDSATEQEDYPHA